MEPPKFHGLSADRLASLYGDQKVITTEGVRQLCEANEYHVTVRCPILKELFEIQA